MNEFALRRNWGPAPSLERVKSYSRPKEFTVISGPCSVESAEQIDYVASEILPWATHLRGGTFRAGTYPNKNFGIVSEPLLAAFQHAARSRGLQNIMEVLSYQDYELDLYMKYADCFQVGCRQMQNYTLLKIVAESGKPVFLKRSTGATIDEFLGAAEHLLFHGAKEIYLIERGSSGFARHVRWDLSISMIPAVQAITDIPILVDASHGTGRRDLVAPMTYAGVAAGADGVLIECHPSPENSLSDSEQAILPSEFREIMTKAAMIRSIKW